MGSSAKGKVSKPVIGIFSRENKDYYGWLVNFLQDSGAVSGVCPVQISNTCKDFSDQVSKVNFAILYHSKKRGRINVTDVTDNLYNEELKELFNAHGRKHVLVVIDDLDDTSDEEKSRIMQNQPSIQQWAQDLFLFSAEDKDRISSVHISQSSADRYQNPPDSVSKKLELMKGLIRGKKGNVIEETEKGQTPDNHPGRNESAQNGPESQDCCPCCVCC